MEHDRQAKCKNKFHTTMIGIQMLIDAGVEQFQHKGYLYSIKPI
jgi:hypothetical protein